MADVCLVVLGFATGLAKVYKEIELTPTTRRSTTNNKLPVSNCNAHRHVGEVIEFKR